MIWDPSIWYTRNDLAIYGGSIWRALVNNKAVIPEAGNTNWELAVGGSSGGSAISGTIASGQVAVGSGTNAIAGSGSLTFDGTTLSITGTPASFGSLVEATVVAPDTANWNSNGAIHIIGDTQSDGATQNPAALRGLFADIESDLPAGRTISTVIGLQSNASNANAGTITNLRGVYTQVLNDSGGAGGTVTNGYAVEAWVYSTDASTHYGSAYNYAAHSSLTASSTVDVAYSFWSGGVTTGATNVYSFWDELGDGVFRIRVDGTFNSKTQSIPALYNPQVAKYTPGATDFERIIMGQWNSNVAEIGTEKGGTGTLRNVRLIGTAIQLSADTILENGKALKTDTTTAHTALLQAYDVDGTAYKTFGTLTNGNTPDFTISPPAGSTVVLQATTYKSSDGSSGVTAGPFTTITAITVKNGLVTALTGS